MPHRSYFISDLHMFSRRSQSRRHEEEIHAAAAKAHTFVLGGDIFDFRWSTLPSVRATVNAAIHWLDGLVTQNNHCDFHFVLGNHDSNSQFVRHLREMVQDMPNLSWYRYFVRLGPSLFLHGDVADRKMNRQKLARARKRWRVDESLPDYRHALYDVVVELRLHKLATTCVYRPKRVAKRIMVYLDDIGHGPHNGLRNVYFGHTHAPITAYEYGGVRFHNGGAPIKGLEFRILETDLSD